MYESSSTSCVDGSTGFFSAGLVAGGAFCLFVLDVGVRDLDGDEELDCRCLFFLSLFFFFLSFLDVCDVFFRFLDDDDDAGGLQRACCLVCCAIPVEVRQSRAAVSCCFRASSFLVCCLQVMCSALAWWILALASWALLCDCCMSASICSSSDATEPP